MALTKKKGSGFRGSCGRGGDRIEGLRELTEGERLEVAGIADWEQGWGTVGSRVPMRPLLRHRTSQRPGRRRRGAVPGERSCWLGAAHRRTWRSPVAGRRCWRMSRLARASAARGPPSWPRSGCESRCGPVSEGRRGRGRGLGGNRHALLTPHCPTPAPRGAPAAPGPLPPC